MAQPVNVANGVASFTNLAIDTIGTYQLLASSNPALTTAMSTSIVVSPAAPFQLVWASGGEPPAQVVHNFPFGAALDLEDKFGNLETGVIGTVSIALDANPGGANLGGDTSADLVGGVASFTSLSISELGSGYTLQATSGSLTSPASTPIMVTPTPAVSLSVTAQPPSNVTVAQGFGFQVTALDQFGNPDPDFNGSVSVALASGPTLTLGGTAHGDGSRRRGDVYRTDSGCRRKRLYAGCQQHGAAGGDNQFVRRRFPGTPRSL